MAGKRCVPERWESYSPIGERIQGTRFIAFKVPLYEKLSNTCEEYLRLDIKTLLKNVPNLGAVVDLTNTNRYYNPDTLKSAGIEHFKLMIPGHATPPSYLVKTFKMFVQYFLQKNKRNDKLIGVHCTHGVNRTGYLICHYMISEMLIKPAEAILAFRTARGYPIERKNYIDSLYSLKIKTKNQRNFLHEGDLIKKQETFSNNRNYEKDNRSQHSRESRNRSQYAIDNRSSNRNSYSNGSIGSRSRRDEESNRSSNKTSYHLNLNRDRSRKRNDSNYNTGIKRKAYSREYKDIPSKRPFENENQNQTWRTNQNNSNSFEVLRSKKRHYNNERDEKYKNEISQPWRSRDHSINNFNPFRSRNGFRNNNEFIDNFNKRDEHFSRQNYQNNYSSWRNRNQNYFESKSNNWKPQKTWNRNGFQKQYIRPDKNENNFDRKRKWNSSHNERT